MKIKRAIDFVKRNAKILLLIYIAVMISVIAVKQIKISKQGEAVLKNTRLILKQNVVLAEGQGALAEGSADWVKDFGEAFMLLGKMNVDLRNKVNSLAETNTLLLVEIYTNIEKDKVKQLKFIDKLIKITNTKEPVKDLTEAQKMGKKLGKDTVEMMKAMEEELHKAGYPW